MALREGRSPTKSEALVERVTALAETVSRDRASFDADGCIPDALFSELASLGLFRLWIPMTLGGVPMGVQTCIDHLIDKSEKYPITPYEVHPY